MRSPAPELLFLARAAARSRTGDLQIVTLSSIH